MPIRIPLRTGDIVLTEAIQHGPERTTADRVVLTDSDSAVSIAMPRELFDRLAEIGDVVTLWSAPDGAR